MVPSNLLKGVVGHTARSVRLEAAMQGMGEDLLDGPYQSRRPIAGN